MARSDNEIAAQTFAGAYLTLPVVADSQDVAFTAGDDVDGSQTDLVEKKTIVLARNTDTGDQTITFVSIEDSLGRLGDEGPYTINAGETCRFGPFRATGWSHSGKLWIDVSDPTVEIAVFTLPTTT